MAGDWIKWRKDLLQVPEVILMARVLQENHAFREWLTPGGGGNEQIVSSPALRAVTAALLGVTWASSREHGVFVGNDLLIPGFEVDDLDGFTGVVGFGHAMAEVGWALDDDKHGGVILPDFIKYNVPMSNAERQKKHRKTVTQRALLHRNKTRYQSRVDDDVPSGTSSGETSVSPSASDLEAILQEHLEHFNRLVAPALHCQPIRWIRGQRREALRKRLEEHPDLWNEVLEEAKHLGQFAYDKGFLDFDFLMTPSKLMKFLEGKYRAEKGGTNGTSRTSGDGGYPTSPVTRRDAGEFQFGAAGE